MTSPGLRGGQDPIHEPRDRERTRHRGVTVKLCGHFQLTADPRHPDFTVPMVNGHGASRVVIAAREGLSLSSAVPSGDHRSRAQPEGLSYGNSVDALCPIRMS